MLAVTSATQTPWGAGRARVVEELRRGASAGPSHVIPLMTSETAIS